LTVSSWFIPLKSTRIERIGLSVRVLRSSDSDSACETSVPHVELMLTVERQFASISCIVAMLK
jgi:hypothetical protein